MFSLIIRDIEMARKIIGSIFTGFGLFMGISTFQVAKSFVFQNYFRINASILIRLVFLCFMFAITAYLIKTGIRIFDFSSVKKDEEKKND